jgi:hypothetical protein
VKITQVKSVNPKSVKKIKKTLVVENVDTISTVYNKSSSPSLGKNIERPPIKQLLM